MSLCSITQLAMTGIGGFPAAFGWNRPTPTVLSWILFCVTQTLLETVISKPIGLPKSSLPMTRTFSEPATHSAVSSEP